MSSLTHSSERLGVDVRPVDSAQDCVEGADIVITITSARDPVALGEWMAPGAHINAAGGNHWLRREIDEEAVLRSEVIVVDDLDQARVECGDLMWLEARGTFRWDMAHELREVVAGRVPGRLSADGLTLFESLGLPWRISLPPSWSTARPGSRVSVRSCRSSRLPRTFEEILVRRCTRERKEGPKYRRPLFPC